MFTKEQVERVKARREAEAAAQTAAPAPKSAELATRTAEPPAAASAPTATAAAPSYQLTLGTILTLRELTDAMAARGMRATEDLPFAALTLAAMMLTDPLVGTVSRERFVELAGAAFDRARDIPESARGKG